MKRIKVEEKTENGKELIIFTQGNAFKVNRTQMGDMSLWGNRYVALEKDVFVEYPVLMTREALDALWKETWRGKIWDKWGLTYLNFYWRYYFPIKMRIKKLFT